MVTQQERTEHSLNRYCEALIHNQCDQLSISAPLRINQEQLCELSDALNRTLLPIQQFRLNGTGGHKRSRANTLPCEGSDLEDLTPFVEAIMGNPILMESLRVLRIENTRLSQFQAIGKLLRYLPIVELHITSCCLDDTSVVSIVESLKDANNINLKILNVFDTNIGNEGVTAIADLLKTNTSLRYLNIIGCRRPAPQSTPLNMSPLNDALATNTTLCMVEFSSAQQPPASLHVTRQLQMSLLYNRYGRGLLRRRDVDNLWPTVLAKKFRRCHLFVRGTSRLDLCYYIVQQKVVQLLVASRQRQPSR